MEITLAPPFASVSRSAAVFGSRCMPVPGTCHRRGDWRRRRREPVSVVAEPLAQPAIAVPRRLVLYQAIGDMENVDRVQEG